MKQKSISVLTALTLAAGVFSAFTISANAEATEIKSAEELYSAMTKGGVYKVADGVTELDCTGSELAVSKETELDLNGATVFVDSNGFNFKAVDGIVTIKNGTISGTGNYGIKCMATNHAATVNIENIVTEGVQNGIATANSYYVVNITGGELNGTKTGVAATMGYYTIKDAEISGITISNESTLDMSKSVINTAGSGIAAYNSASADIEECNITGANNGLFWKSNGSLNVTGSEISSSSNGKGTIQIENSTASVTITDTDVINTNETAAKAYIIATNSADASNITINSGTFRGVLALNAASSTQLTINGGLFRANPEAYLAEGLGAFKNSDGMYEVVESSEMPTQSPTQQPQQTTAPDPDKTQAPAPTTDPVAVPTEMPESADVSVISTADELASALIAGGTYKIADGAGELDCSALTLSVRKSVSVDLNGASVKVPSNGFDVQGGVSAKIKNGIITGEGNYAIKAMAKTPSLVILDNVTTTGVKNGIACANSYSLVTITGGNIDGVTSGIACTMGNVTVNNAKTGGITINNLSSIELNRAEINTAGSGIAAYGSASAEIIDSNITGANYGLFWKSSGALDITDSEISSSTNGKGTANFESTTAHVTIKDSAISNTNETISKAYIITTNSADASEISINGGTYSGVIAINSSSAATLEIISGIFSSDPSSYLADGSTFEKDENGMFVVTGGTSTDPDETPTALPTEDPDDTPTESPTEDPDDTPTESPTEKPDDAPTESPTEKPTADPDKKPSGSAKYEDGKIVCTFADVEDKTGTVYGAEYDSNGILINLKAVPLNTSVIIDYPDKTGYIKIFVWDQEQNPLMDSISL